MKKLLRFGFCALVFPVCSKGLPAQETATTVVFSEPGFPTADTAGIPTEQLQKLVPNARIVSADKLKTELANKDTKLLVLGYGSAFPESESGDIFAFLRHGGNLVVIGGRP